MCGHTDWHTYFLMFQLGKLNFNKPEPMHTKTIMYNTVASRDFVLFPNSVC